MLFVYFFFNLGHSIRDNTSRLCSSLRPRKVLEYYTHCRFKFTSGPSHVQRNLMLILNCILQLWDANSMQQNTASLHIHIHFFFFFQISKVYSSQRYLSLNQQLVCLCSISKLLTPFWKYNNASYRKLSKELKNGIRIEIGQVVLELLIKPLFLLFWPINYTTWSTKISMPSLSSLDNLL